MDSTVTLDNCDREPIHIPGAVQPHGVLLALDGQTLAVRSVSANAEGLLGIPFPELCARPLAGIVDAQTEQLIRQNLGVRSWKRLNPIATEINSRKFDAILHWSGSLLLVELEPADLVPQGSYRDYGADTHQAMVRLQGAESFADLLQSAAEAVRWVTGYDRVMVYRFSEEGHGQVVAEDRQPSLEPFVGQHYPASDIPAQARRLYLLNWLRIIADIDYRPAALLAAPGSDADEPLDLTYSTLRSVSPIHCEYLRNMGVAASMSVSLVVDGKLWGMLACHHYSPKFVPYSVRMTCELLGQMLSTLVQSWQRREESERQDAVGVRRVRLLERLNGADYIAAVVQAAADDWLEIVGAAGAAVLEDGRYTAIGDCPPEPAVRELAAWLVAEGRDLVVTHRAPAELAAVARLGDHGTGVLAVGLESADTNALFWFRPEVQKTVSWAGNPEKTYAQGPNGPRLSPRGSFELWKETVRGQSERWSELEVETAKQLRAAIAQLFLRKSRDMERSRDLMLGMLSHDLRNPLGAISVAAELLKVGEPEPSRVTRASARIAASSDRMHRMIEQLLDFTRARAGTLELNAREIDLVTLVRQLVEEVEAAHPGTRIELNVPSACQMTCDPDRMAQIISNLLGNARHHGDPSQPVRLSLRCDALQTQLRVQNQGSPIPPEKLAHIFEPFKRGQSQPAAGKPAGLGLGLFIVRNFVELHGGEVVMTSSAEEGTTCTITLPQRNTSG